MFLLWFIQQTKYLKIKFKIIMLQSSKVPETIVSAKSFATVPTLSILANVGHISKKKQMSLD